MGVVLLEVPRTDAQTFSAFLGVWRAEREGAFPPHNKPIAIAANVPDDAEARRLAEVALE